MLNKHHSFLLLVLLFFGLTLVACDNTNAYGKVQVSDQTTILLSGNFNVTFDHDNQNIATITNNGHTIIYNDGELFVNDNFITHIKPASVIKFINPDEITINDQKLLIK